MKVKTSYTLDVQVVDAIERISKKKKKSKSNIANENLKKGLGLNADRKTKKTKT